MRELEFSARIVSVERKRNCLHVKKNINVLYVHISMNYQEAKFLFGYFSHRPFLTAPSIQLQAVSVLELATNFRRKNGLFPEKRFLAEFDRIKEKISVFSKMHF